MRAAWLLAATLLAGCATPSAIRVAPLDAPSPDQLVPDLGDLPPGFHLGWTQSLGDAGVHAYDGRSAIFERNNATQRHSLTFVILRFATPAEAAAEYARMNQTEYGAVKVMLGPETALHRETHEDPEHPGSSLAGIDRIVARQGHFLVFATSTGQGARPLDVAPLVEKILDEAAARPHASAHDLR